MSDCRFNAGLQDGRCGFVSAARWWGVLMLGLWVGGGSTARAQAKPGLPQIPFFNAGNPLEQFFGQRDPAELNELKKVAIAPQEERAYGERVLDAMRQDLRKRRIQLVERGDDVEYVRRLLDTLRPQMANHQRYASLRVLVAQTDETDAYSIPGGTIVVYRGMIDIAGSEAALVGVLGHELSHLDHGHQLLPLQRQKLFQSTAGGKPVANFDQFMRQASAFMSGFMRPFRPEDETEADRDGATWAYRSDYDPREMAALFVRLSARNPNPGGQFMPAFLRTHPFHADRQAAVEALFQDLQQAEPRAELYVGRENIRRRTPMAVRRFRE